MNRSIVAKFILRSILVLSGSIIVIELLTYDRISDTVKRLTLENAEHQTTQFGETIEAKLISLELDSVMVSESESLKDYYLNISYGLMTESNRVLEHSQSLIRQLQARVPEYENIAFCSEQFELLTTTIRGNADKSKKLFEHCNANTEIIDFEVFHPNENLDYWYVVVRKPVKRKEQLLGYVEVSMNLDALIHKIETSHFVEKGFYTIQSNRDQVYVSSYPDAKSTQSAVILLDKHADSDLVTTSYRIDQLDWTISSHIPKKDMYSDLNQILINALITIVFVLVFEVLMLYGFVKQIVLNPLKKLIEGTERFNQGQLDYRIDRVSNDELGTLTKAFNVMGDYVEKKLAKLRKQTKELELSESRLKYILNNTSAIVCIKDIDGTYTFVNNAYMKLVGLESEQIIGRNDVELFDTEVAEIYQHNDTRVVNEKKVYRFEEHARKFNGDVEHHISVKIPLFDLKGEVYGICNIATDITDMKIAQEALKESHHQLRLIAAIFESSREGFVILNKEFEIVDVNPAMTRLFGYEKEEFIGNTPELLNSGAHETSFHQQIRDKINKDGFWHGEIWERSKDGDIFPQMLSIGSVSDEDGHLTHYAAIYSDISELKRR
jgi:PAS domain S-box-containing protein